MRPLLCTSSVKAIRGAHTLLSCDGVSRPRKCLAIMERPDFRPIRFSKLDTPAESRYQTCRFADFVVTHGKTGLALRY